MMTSESIKFNKDGRCLFPCSGFTLVEMLVVVALLLILGVIALPVFGQMRGAALQSQCLGNLRNYGMGVMSYVTDRGSLPWWDGGASKGLDAASTTPNFEDWTRPYLHRVFNSRLRCPLGTPAAKAKAAYLLNYSGNGALCQYYPKLKGIPAPSSRVVLAAEIYNFAFFNHEIHLNITMWGINDGVAGGSADSFETAKGSYQTPQFHGSAKRPGLHFFFLDGHSELVVPEGGDWRNPPTMGAATNGGYFYSRSQFAKMKAGILQAQ